MTDRLLTTHEVAALFRVDPKTVARWAAAGRLASIRTPGGHRRYREVEVHALLDRSLPEQVAIANAEAASPLSDHLPAGVDGAAIGTRGGAR